MNRKDGELDGLLARLARSTVMSEGKLEEALKAITKTAALALEVDRVNVWVFDQKHTKISCIEAYQTNNLNHTLGEEIFADAHPNYFEALKNLRAIAAIDTFNDPRTQELYTTYLSPHGVTTMLDAPLYVAGEVVGVVCHEHTGEPREWTHEEMCFAAAIADLVSIALETDRRIRAEQHSLALQTKMMDSQRLESLGLLASGIAHDFRNLLGSILGNVGLVKRNLHDPVKAQRFLTDIEIACARASDLCKQLLAFSGKEQLNLAPINLSLLAQEIVRLLKASIPPTAILICECSDDLPLIEADETQIRQVILNLVTNAVQALDRDGGTITVRTTSGYFSTDALGQFFQTTDLADKTYVSIEVADTGAGMSQEIRKQMFEPFFTTKSTGKGLGMAVVLGIIRRHRGAIKVESQTDIGTTIQVLFPVR
jgi:two-component system, cell cycle sensor histidine kinase and response regulator CckA